MCIGDDAACSEWSNFVWRQLPPDKIAPFGKLHREEGALCVMSCKAKDLAELGACWQKMSVFRCAWIVSSL